MKRNEFPLELISDNQIKILVIDDEINILRNFIRVFYENKRFKIETANSGFIAGAKLEEFRPDIIILDIYLGDMDGRDLSDYLRKKPEYENIKIIGMSGKLNSKEIRSALDGDFDSFFYLILLKMAYYES